jgi:hypothetical protein
VRETRRYLGLELAGAKNHKTALAALEYYPKERKLFLLDIFDRIAGHRDAHGEGENEGGGSSRSRPGASIPGGANGPLGLTTSGDEALLDLLHEILEDAPRSVTLGVNVPLTLPPAIACLSKAGSKPSAASLASAKWMRDAHRKAERQAHTDDHLPRVIEYTTYTQRPIELWIRYQVLGRLPASHRFEIDEAMGGNKAPLTARMHFLLAHLRKWDSLSVLEAWPKLTVALLAQALEIPKRTLEDYRQLETGLHAREEILERLTETQDVFIYERDVRKLAMSLTAFDAFICAYTAYLSDTGRCAKIPAGFPAASGWVQYPVC